ncbi:hypothetical protein, partial [Sinomonas soli]
RTDSVMTGTAEGDIDVAKVFFGADYSDDRNQEWAAATPAASLQMTVRREIADAQGWKQGTKVTVTID